MNTNESNQGVDVGTGLDTEVGSDDGEAVLGMKLGDAVFEGFDDGCGLWRSVGYSVGLKDGIEVGIYEIVGTGLGIIVGMEVGEK